MAIREYIGARYVPKFMGTYDPTQVYEALDVVDNGLGTSYIAKVPTPAGTPLTNTTYWAIYGATSGAIINLQNQINDMKDGDLSGSLQNQINANASGISALNDAVDEIPKHHKYVLIGDSFGVGIQGGGQPWGDGWEYHFHNDFPSDSYFYDPQSDPSFEGSAGFSTGSDVDFIHQLNYVYANKLGTTNAEEITDVVVLGGTNDIAYPESSIKNNIGTFCDRVKAIFPNAIIKIGIVGQNIRAMVNTSDVYKAYKEGAYDNGAIFLQDCMLLGCNYTYDSGYGHWNLTGYAHISPYIEQMIISNHCQYDYKTSFPMTLGSDASLPQYSFTYELELMVNERGIRFNIIDSTRKTPICLQVTKLTDLVRTGVIFNVTSNNTMYYPFELDINGAIATCDCYYNQVDGQIYRPSTKGVVYMFKDTNTYKLKIEVGFPNFYLGSTIGDNSYSSFICINPYSSPLLPMTKSN